MCADRYPNFDQAFFNKYVTLPYFLSKGANGSVYGPIQQNDMQLAIKQTMFAAGKVTEKLKKEIEAKKDILASIEHKHLMRIHSFDLSQLPKAMSIVMEFAAGGSLYDALRSLEKSGEKLPIYIVRDWAKQIAEGMLYLHQKDIIHRDLKSSNILLMEPFDIRKPYTKMSLKIGDFDEVKDHDHTMTMSLVGTVAYMAPEVIVKQRFSKGSDVWSYGVVIWEMVTGDTPHKGLEPTTIIHKAVKGELDNLKIEKSFPLFLKQLLKRCLEPNLRKRASFHDVVSFLLAKLIEKYNSDSVLIHSIEGIAAKETRNSIIGLAILDNELFVVTRESSDIEVYDAIKLSFRRRMHLNELISPVYITSCKRSKCLYILDTKGVNKSDAILRVDSNAKLIKNWSIGNSHGYTVSITDESNVIISVGRVLKVYSPDGQLISQINLSVDAGIQYIRHAIKLSNGDFLVSCDSVYEEPYRVCIVDAVGKLTRSFGGKCGPNREHRPVQYSEYFAIDEKLTRSFGVKCGPNKEQRPVQYSEYLAVDEKPNNAYPENSEQMRRSVYLSVDGNEFVFVADLLNSRVLLLDSNLTFQREILSKEKHGLQSPSTIILDESNGRMLVADVLRILIFQIKE